MDDKCEMKFCMKSVALNIAIKYIYKNWTYEKK